MDIATHALLGASAGYAIGGRQIGRPAAAIGALGGSLPDLDVFLRNATDPLFALEFHRHFSHSLVFSLITSIGVGLVLHCLFKRGSKRMNIALVLVGYLSAILLDACTSYGTHLFWPFSDQRVALSIISIVDPILSVALILSLTITLAGGRARASVLVLVFCGCYLSVAALQQYRARTLLVDTMSSQHPALTRVLVKPSFGNVVLWRGLAWNEQEIASAAVRPGLLSKDLVYIGEHGKRPGAKQLADWSGHSSIHENDVKRFAQLSAQLLIIHPSRPAMLGDARFALLPHSLEPLWGIEVNQDAKSEHVDYVTNRNMTAARRTQFSRMLLGRALP